MIETIRNLVGFKATEALPLSPSIALANPGSHVNAFSSFLGPKALARMATDDEFEDSDIPLNDRLSEFLYEQREYAIASVLASAKIEAQRSLRPLFQNRGHKSNTSDIIGKTEVGWRFDLLPSKYSSMRIKNAIFHGTTEGIIPIKIWRADLREGSVIPLVYDTPGEPKTFDIGVLCAADSPDAGIGVTWLATYDSQEYAGLPINRGVNWLEACPPCGISFETISIDILAKRGVSARPCYFSASHDFVPSSDNFGLNFEIETFCNTDALLLDHALDEVVQAVKLDLAVRLLKHVLENPSRLVNKTSTQASDVSDKVSLTLYGDSEGRVEGLLSKLDKALVAVSNKTSSMPLCFEDVRPRGPRILHR